MSNPNPKNKFTAGNNIWTRRHKHGRDKIFKTPTALANAAKSYFDFVDSTPIVTEELKSVSLGEGVTEIRRFDVYHQRPYTLMEFANYCGASQSYWRNFKAGCVKSGTAEDSDFLTVIEWVESCCYAQKLTGATVGIFNSNIIARVLGLGEKVESTNINLTGDLSPDAVKKISKDLEDNL